MFLFRTPASQIDFSLAYQTFFVKCSLIFLHKKYEIYFTWCSSCSNDNIWYDRISNALSRLIQFLLSCITLPYDNSMNTLIKHLSLTNVDWLSILPGYLHSGGYINLHRMKKFFEFLSKVLTILQLIFITVVLLGNPFYVV